MKTCFSGNTFAGSCLFCCLFGVVFSCGNFFVQFLHDFYYYLPHYYRFSFFFLFFFRQPTRSLLLTTRSFISKYSWHERERTLNGQNWFRETRTINGQLLQESAVCKAYCVTPQFWLIIRAASYPTTVGYWRPTTKNVMLKRKLKSKCSTVFAGQLWQSTRRRPLVDGSVGCVVLFIYFSLSFQKRSMHLVF